MYFLKMVSELLVSPVEERAFGFLDGLGTNDLEGKLFNNIRVFDLRGLLLRDLLQRRKTHLSITEQHCAGRG